tara:strand:- start:2873 stop:3325 length:453 start_codon:yes stop_codon:yes gene_type:complete
MPKLSKEEIDAIKAKRASEKRLMIDSLRKNVGTLAVPSIMIMVGTLVGSAYYLKSEALAVVTGLVSTVTLGLINVLQQMTAPPEKPSDIAKASENLHHAIEKQMDYNSSQLTLIMNLLYAMSIGEKNSLYGNDKKIKKDLIDEILKKGKK